jgi:hypothetical protein
VHRRKSVNKRQEGRAGETYQRPSHPTSAAPPSIAVSAPAASVSEYPRPLSHRRDCPTAMRWRAHQRKRERNPRSGKGKGVSEKGRKRRRRAHLAERPDVAHSVVRREAEQTAKWEEEDKKGGDSGCATRRGSSVRLRGDALRSKAALCSAQTAASESRVKREKSSPAPRRFHCRRFSRLSLARSLDSNPTPAHTVSYLPSRQLAPHSTARIALHQLSQASKTFGAAT